MEWITSANCRTGVFSFFWLASSVSFSPQHLVFVTPLLLPATILEEFQLYHNTGM
jgi:hypothetical protein